MNMTSATSNDPIFLVGAERSGSTLLRLVLSHHSRIAWLNEFEYSVDMIDSPDHWPDADPYHEWLRTHRIFQASGLRCEGDTYPEIVRGFLSQFAQRSGRPIVGATVHRNFDRLLRLWPDARFIHILRDPRDVARSCIGMGWAGNVYAGARLWIDAEQTWGRLIDQADPSRRIEVRYEDLVRDPDRALRPVCAFLGVDYEPGMLEIGATTTYERPDPSFAEQWRRKLTDAEIRLVESRVGDLLASRGYEPSGLPHLQVSWRRRALLNVHDRIGRLRFRIDRFGPRLWLADLVARRFGLSSLRVRTTRRMNEITAAHLK